MSRYDRQKYRDVDPTTIDANRYPITQLKFDGIWCGVESDGAGHLRYFSRNGQLKYEHKTTTHTPAGFFVGEFMYGSEWSTQEDRSGKLFLFDVTELKGSGLTNQSYLQRHNTLTRLRNERAFPDTWKVIANYPTLQIDSIWLNLVASGKFEGVVFRNPDDLWNVDICRAKLSITEDLRIIDFEEGKDGNAGSLGAFIAVDSSGVAHSIGGGITKKMRQDAWKNPELYRGKIIVIEAKKKFASGKFRHPNFLCIHPDKTKL